MAAIITNTVAMPDHNLHSYQPAPLYTDFLAFWNWEIIGLLQQKGICARAAGERDWSSAERREEDSITSPGARLELRPNATGCFPTLHHSSRSDKGDAATMVLDLTEDPYS